MQDISFRNVDEFLDYLPDNERLIVDWLREVILECLPECQEKLAYNVPYYYGKRRICFIWPASVPWGKVARNGVMLGFSKGYLLNDEIGFLEKGNRKQVFTKTYFEVVKEEEDILKAFLYESLELDR